MWVWGPFEEPEAWDVGRMLGRREPGASWEGPQGEAHHGRQREALVPLRVGRLLQDLAAELENTEDRWMEQRRDSGLPWGPKASQWPLSVMLATLQAGKKALRSLGS